MKKDKKSKTKNEKDEFGEMFFGEFLGSKIQENWVWKSNGIIFDIFSLDGAPEIE